MPKSFALLDLRDKIVDARMQSKGMQNPEVEGRTHHGWPPKGGSACGEGLGCSGRRNSYLPKEKARKKKAQDFILFWKGQNRPNPESRDERPPGNHQGREGNWSKGIRKIKIFLYGERSPRGTIIFDTKCETEKNNFFLFGHKGKKRPGKGINIGPELCPREGYHISGNNNLTKERE